MTTRCPVPEAIAAAAESELRADYRRIEEMGERTYISTTAGLLADVLCRQGRYDESAELAGICEHLAFADDVASQFPWRCVRGKLKARLSNRRGRVVAIGGDGAHRDLGPP